MGARLVQLALMRWSHVSDRAFRVLVRMALTALDEPQNGQQAGLYFGGRDLLATVIRSGEDVKREVVYRTVSKAVAELIEVGAIERTNVARSGEKQVYSLRLESMPIKPQGVPSGHAQGVSPGHAQGVPTGPESMSPRDTPRNQEEPREELEEEKNDDLRTAGTVARATKPEKIGCEKGCARGYLLVGDSLIRCDCNNVIPFPTAIAEEAS